MQVKTDAIVLRRADYRDNDRMLTLFSPTLGRVDALCRGCRKQKSPLMTASELFTVGEYVLYHANEHYVVTACTVSERYYPLRADYERLAHGAYALELCAIAVQPGEEHQRLFLFLLRTLAHLAYGDAPPRRVTVVFLMGFASLLGFRPAVSQCARCGRPLPTPQGMTAPAGAFSPEGGGVLCEGCRSPSDCALLGRDLLTLQHVMRRGLDALTDADDCPDSLFAALRSFAEQRLETPIRSSKLL